MLFAKSVFHRTYCLIGDGESAEGSIWEALSFAGIKKLDNLVAIFDINRLGQSEPTAFQHDMDAYRSRLEGFGWNTLVVDGHDIEAICKVTLVLNMLIAVIILVGRGMHLTHGVVILVTKCLEIVLAEG